MTGILGAGYYHMYVIYISGGRTSHLYEINKEEKIVEDILYKIEKLVPAITFDATRVYPKRIRRSRVFVSESPFEESSDTLRNEHPEGYLGNFGGSDVTLEISAQALSRDSAGATPQWIEGKGDDLVEFSREASNSVTSAAEHWNEINVEHIEMDEPQEKLYEEGLDKIDEAEFNLKLLEARLFQYRKAMDRRTLYVAIISAIIGGIVDRLVQVIVNILL